jgi:hypothetical protein
MALVYEPALGGIMWMMTSEDLEIARQTRAVLA